MTLAIGLQAWAEKPEPDLAAGKQAYEQSCARCHGMTGEGDGVDAKRFYPRPRDLAYGVYKFRSTVSGTPPTDEDIFYTLTTGLHGTNMPDWQHLDEQTRWQIIHYTKSLSDIFEELEPEPVQVPKGPGAKHADLAKGREVYEQLGCASCHGAQGRANGMSAAGLVDDWGMPMRPANLTQGWSYRGGNEPQDIIVRFLAGIDGAGMPSYDGVVEPEAAWHLAYYVASLQEPVVWNRILHAPYHEGDLPSTVDDPRWDSIPSSGLRLRNKVNANGEWEHPPTINHVAVKLVHNGERLAFHLTWDDPTEDATVEDDRLTVVLHTEGNYGDSESLQVWPFRGARELDLNTWFAQGNRSVAVVSSDYPTRSALAGSAPLTTHAAYHDGRWQLVLVRPFKQAGISASHVIKLSEPLPIGFAIRDGGMPESLAISAWVDVTLQPVDATHQAHAAH